MRRYVLILMLVLLPLRGWVGEAMAMQMLAQHLNAIQTIATTAHEISANGTLDAEIQAKCHEAGHGASHAADANPADADPSTSHCGTCPLCQMCHTVAAPAPFSAMPPPWLPHAQPTTGPARFASAPTTFALKPPIS